MKYEKIENISNLNDIYEKIVLCLKWFANRQKWTNIFEQFFEVFDVRIFSYSESPDSKIVFWAKSRAS